MRPLLITPEELRAQATGRKLAVLTGGGDAPGMNAALRAVVRSAISAGAEAYAIFDGYQGLIDGGDSIREMAWKDVAGTLSRGGTIIGTYRSADFRDRAGRLKAVHNLVSRGIDRLVVIGGDGSLTGLSILAEEWDSLLAELVATKKLKAAAAKAHPRLIFAGLVGSIDNDLVGTDQTIGADTALHRIHDAIDAIASTAASHQRAFVVEVMGRHCGYLALMTAVSGGCDYVIIPERPPAEGWEQVICQQLQRSRAAGRKDAIVILAEGVADRQGRPITAEQVRQAIEQGLGEETRVTILGHVQRGGTPSAYDRWASSWLGYSAAAHVLTSDGEAAGPVFGFHGHQVVALPLLEAVAKTRQVPDLIAAGDYEAAVAQRGEEFADTLRYFDELTAPAVLQAARSGQWNLGRRVGIMHAGGLAPGMNTAAKALVRLGLARGYEMIGIQDGFPGLMARDYRPISWQEVDNWDQEGGAALGTRRFAPQVEDLYAIARAIEETKLDALIVIGGWTAYQGVALMLAERDRYPSLALPVICLPASIDNNLPATQMTIGADTALNVIVEAIDRIRTSASSSQRCFVAETMGRDCGFLALMAGIAAGAEQVYMNEFPLTLASLQADLEDLLFGYDEQKRSFWLTLRNENANANYTTDVLAHIIDEAGQGRYDTRTMILGHIQQGGTPTPADRVLAIQLARQALGAIAIEWEARSCDYYCVGVDTEEVILTDLADAMKSADARHQRPIDQWWLGLASLIPALNRGMNQR